MTERMTEFWEGIHNQKSDFVKNSFQEILLLGFSIFIFLANTNISTGNALARIGCYGLLLLCYALTRYLIFFRILKSNQMYSQANKFIGYIALLIEFGIMMNLYIIGFKEKPVMAVVLDYIMGLAKPLSFLIALIVLERLDESRYPSTGSYLAAHGFCVVGLALLIHGIPTDSDNQIVYFGLSGWVVSIGEAVLIVLFVSALYNQTFFRNAVLWFESPRRYMMVFGICFGTGVIVFIVLNIHFADSDNRYADIIPLIPPAGILLLWRILTILHHKAKSRNSSATDFMPDIIMRLAFWSICICGAGAVVLHGNTSARNAFIEVMKFMLLLTLAACHTHKYHQLSALPPEQTNTVRKQSNLYCFLCFLIVMGSCMLAGEMGTLIILLLFYLFFSVKFETLRFPVLKTDVLLTLVFVAFIAMWGILKINPQIAVSNPLFERIFNRIFNIDGYVQVNELNTIIDESNLFFRAIPYSVDMVGSKYTRVEDFSYMNLISIFGLFFAVAFIGYMLIVPIKLFFQLNASARRHTLFSTMSQFSILLFVSNIAVHTISNTGIYFFTGVTLPFISNGFMNTLIFLFLLTPVICTLDENS